MPCDVGQVANLPGQISNLPHDKLQGGLKSTLRVYGCGGGVVMGVRPAPRSSGAINCAYTV
jgi:hypothetical protein